MPGDTEALWQEIDAMRNTLTQHAVVHGRFDERINAVSSTLHEVRAKQDEAREERNKQHAVVLAEIKAITAVQHEEKGAKSLKTQLITWGLTIAGMLGLGAWIHGGGK